jgi:hypothetical protein
MFGGFTSWNYIGQDARRFRHYGPVRRRWRNALNC